MPGPESKARARDRAQLHKQVWQVKDDIFGMVADYSINDLIFRCGTCYTDGGSLAGQVKVVRFRRDDRPGPAIDEFGVYRAEIDATLAARTSIIVVPVRAMKGDPCAGKEGHPGHAGQVVRANLNISLICHVDGWPLVVRQKITNRSCGGAGAGGTTRDQHRIVPFESSHGLGRQVNVDGLEGFGNVRGEGGKLFVRYDAHFIGRNVVGATQVKIVKFIPDTLLFAIDNRFSDPVRGLVVQPIAVVRPDIWVKPRNAIGDRNFTQLSAFMYHEVRFLVYRLYRLQPAGVGVSFVANAIPGVIVRVSILAANESFRNGDNLVFAEGFALFAGKAGRIIKYDSADQSTALAGR